MRIKFNLAKFDKATAFQILEQDEAFTGKRFSSSNGILLKSDGAPSISDTNRNIVNLRGTSKESNLNTTINYFASNEERDHFYNRLLEALDEFSKNADKWLVNV